MDLLDYTFTKKYIIRKVYKLYLQGYSIEEIFVKLNLEIEVDMINNIIDCTNYLYL